MKLNKACNLVVLLLVLAIGPTCKAVKKYKVEFRDQNANLVASGSMSLPRELAADGAYTGSFAINLTELGVASTNRSVGFLRDILGNQAEGNIELKYANKRRFIENSQMAMNFNPNVADQSIKVFASFDEAGIRGAWYLELFEGGTKGGDFFAKE